MRRIEILTTGGTIEKTYDEYTGELSNRGSIVRRMIRRLKLPDVTVHIRELLSKDSLFMTDADRQAIVEAVRTVLAMSPRPDGVVILHGTDTLCVTGERLHAALVGDEGAGTGAGGSASPGTRGANVRAEGAGAVVPADGLAVPVVLTGAMRPYEMKRSDALQNLTESILATSLLGAGVYAVAHGKALMFPGVVKDRAKGTFVRG